MTHFKWTEVRIGAIQALTGEGTKPITPEEHIKKALGFDQAATRGDDRPTLVYFHWPHEHSVHGKLTTTICERTLNEEELARWGKLFRCVQIDMGDTEEEFAAMIGVGDGPSFVALDKDAKVVAQIKAEKSSTKLRKGLEKAFAKFPDYKKRVKREMANHRKWMAQAKKLEKKDEFEDALELIDKIRFGDIRIGSEYDKAVAYGMRLAKKIEQDLMK